MSADDKDYIFRFVDRTLLILDPDTLEERGRFELPDRFTMADAENVFRAMADQARKNEVGPS